MSVSQRSQLRMRLIAGLVLLAAVATPVLPAPLAGQGLVAKGLRFGVSQSIDDEWVDHRVGVQAGALWTYWMAGGRLAFQPEVLAIYNRYTFELVVDPFNPIADDLEQLDFGQGSASLLEFHVPLLFKVNLGRASGTVTSVYLGPVVGAGFVTNVSGRASAGQFDSARSWGPLELGGLTGIGFGFGRYAVDLRASVVGPYIDAIWRPAALPDGGCCRESVALKPMLDLSASFAILW